MPSVWRPSNDLDAFSFGEQRRRRRLSLTPMIDVVFLLLVFFILVARFGVEQGLEIGMAGRGIYEGPPRLVEVFPDGIRLNGVELSPEAIGRELARLTDSPDDLVVLRGRDGADTQAVVRAVGLLAEAGFARVALVE